MFKINNINTWTRCEVKNSVSIVNFEQVNAYWPMNLCYYYFEHVLKDTTLVSYYLHVKNQQGVKQ